MKVNGWPVKPLRELCILRPPKAEARKRLSANSAVSFLPMEDLGIDEKYPKPVQSKMLTEVQGSYTYFADGDVLLAKVTPCFQNGKVGIAKGLCNGVGFGSSEFFVLRPHAELDSEYLYYFLSRADFREEGVQRMGGAVGLQRVPPEFVLSEWLPLPPLPEQRRIVGLLDQAFAAIAAARANTEKNLRNAREVFESQLQSVFTLGDGWIEKCLGQIAEFKNGLNFNQSSNGASVRVVGVGDFGDNYVVPLADLQSVTIDDELNESYEIREHDLLTVRSNGSKDLVGRCMIVPSINEAISYSGFVIRIRPDTTFIVPRFLLHFMKCSATRDRLTRDGGGTNISNINQGKLSVLTIPLPSLKAQHRIVETLDQLREETQRLASLYHQKFAALDALKKSLLHQAFSGPLTAAESPMVIETKPADPFPIQIPGISTTDLHAGILALACRRHEEAGKLSEFTHVKAEKFAHMVEARLGIDLGRQPVKDAAGPNDFNHLKKVEHRARKTNAFDFKQTDGGAYRVQKLHGFDRLIDKTRNVLGDRFAQVETLLDWMLPMSVRQAEIVATVFAAWNNLLLDGQQPTDEQIVYEARENWHKEKLKIERKRFFSAIEWMRKEGIVPSGKGKRVVAKES